MEQESESENEIRNKKLPGFVSLAVLCRWGITSWYFKLERGTTMENGEFYIDNT